MRARVPFKIILFVVFVIVCFSQCYTILRNYLKYPTIIGMYDVSPSLVTIMPGITLCNNNRLSLRKLAKRNATIRDAMNKRFPNWYTRQPKFVEPVEFNAFRDGISKIFERLNYDPDEEMKNATMDSWFEMKPDTSPFIKKVECASTWTDTLECAKLTVVDSSRSRRCSTLLHKGAMLYDTVSRPELFNSSEANITYFDEKEVIKLVVDFGAEDYADLKRQIGARVLFHDSNEIPSDGEMDFFITRGYRYDYSIDRKDIKIIGEPYMSCLDYEEENLAKYQDRIDPRVPLASQQCIHNCIVKNIVHKANCWPYTIPYFRNDSLDLDLKLRPCKWFRGSHHVSIFEEMLRIDDHKRKLKQATDKKLSNSTATLPPQPPPPPEVEDPANKTSEAPRPAPTEDFISQKMKFYRKIRRFCFAQCLLACKSAQYTVISTRSVWPTDVVLASDKSGIERFNRHCCALLTIKFAHYHYRVQEFEPKYKLADTLGDLGGILAVWLGISIVSVYCCVRRIVEFYTVGLLEKNKTARRKLARCPFRAFGGSLQTRRNNRVATVAAR